jgi:geranylgeranyl transferase type-1 subunit beta
MANDDERLKANDKFFVRNLGSLPHHYTAADSQRLTLSFFCLSGRELLHPESPWSTEEKGAWIDWIYAQQILTLDGRGGFRGGPFAGAPFDAPMVILLIH